MDRHTEKYKTELNTNDKGDRYGTEFNEFRI